MATATYDDKLYNSWRDETMPLLPGAAPDMVNHAIQRTIHDFLLRTGVWRDMIYARTVTGRRYTTLIPSLSNAVVSFVLAASYKGTPIATTFDEPWAANISSSSSISAVRFTPPNRLNLRETPTEDTSTDLELEVALAPVVGASVVPAILQTHYFEAISAGVLSKLHMHADKPYTNIDLARGYRFKFLQAISTARENVLKGYSKAETPFQFNQHFR